LLLGKVSLFSMKTSIQIKQLISQMMRVIN